MPKKPSASLSVLPDEDFCLHVTVKFYHYGDNLGKILKVTLANANAANHLSYAKIGTDKIYYPID